MFAYGRGLLAVTLLASLTACSGSDDKKSALKNQAPRGQGNSTKTGCVYDFDDGVKLSSTLPARDIRVTFFGKKLDLSRLKAVGAASARSTYEFMKADGVDAYHTRHDKEETCLLFTGIPEATGGIRSAWNEVNTEGGLLGLFLPVNRVQDAGFASSRPVIMLRADTDRYTLVHEYMHFVFNALREAEGKSDAELMARFKLQMANYERLGKGLQNESKADLSAFIDAYLALGHTMLEVVDAFPLEEMTIESILKMANARGELSHVNKQNLHSSSSYILNNYVTAYNFLDDYVNATLGKTIVKNLKRLGDSRAAHVEALLRQVDERNAEAKTLVEKYARAVGPQKLASGISLGEAHVHTAECGREGQLKKILEGAKTSPKDVQDLIERVGAAVPVQ